MNSNMTLKHGHLIVDVEDPFVDKEFTAKTTRNLELIFCWHARDKMWSITEKYRGKIVGNKFYDSYEILDIVRYKYRGLDKVRITNIK